MHTRSATSEPLARPRPRTATTCRSSRTESARIEKHNRKPIKVSEDDQTLIRAEKTEKDMAEELRGTGSRPPVQVEGPESEAEKIAFDLEDSGAINDENAEPGDLTDTTGPRISKPLMAATVDESKSVARQPEHTAYSAQDTVHSIQYAIYSTR